MAKSLLVQGKLAEAKQVVLDGERLAAKIHSKITTLEFVIVDRQVDAAKGDHTRGVALLKTAVADAKKLGCLTYQFEASLALGEVELRSGDVNTGRARLTSLVREADAKGYSLVARKARTALGGSL